MTAMTSAATHKLFADSLTYEAERARIAGHMAEGARISRAMQTMETQVALTFLLSAVESLLSARDRNADDTIAVALMRSAYAEYQRTIRDAREVSP
jgi:hypothetical protein